MSDMQQTIGIVIKADGTVELANGMKLTGAQIKGVAGTLDDLGTKLEQTEVAEKKTGAAAADMAGKMGEAGKAAAQAASDLKNGDYAGAAAQVQQVASTASGMSASMIVGAAAVGALVIGVGALVFIASKGTAEQRALNNQLILTGNYAGLVTGQIDTMARSVATGINGTVGSSREVLSGLTATGQFTTQSMTEVASAVQLVARFSGQTNDQVLKHFASMSDGVAKWAEKANESYHFLDLATYRYIKRLEEQGNTQEAMRVSSVALSNHLGNDLTKNLGVLERGWLAVMRAASSAWAAMKEVGKTDSMDQRIAEAEDRLAKSKSGVGARSASGQQGIAAQEASLAAMREVAQLQRRGVENASERAQATQRAIKAEGEWEKIVESNLTKTQRLDKEIEKIRKTGKDNGRSSDEIDAQVAAARAKAEKPAGAPKAYTDDAATRYLQNLRDQNAAVLAQLVSQDQLTGAQKKQAEFAQQVADLKEKKVLTAEQKSLLANADAINLQLRENVLAERLLKIKDDQTKKDKERAEALAKATQFAEGLNRTMASAQEGRDEQYDRTLSVFGKGSEAREQMEASKSIYREFQRTRQQWNKESADKGILGTDVYQAQLEKIDAAQASALQKLGEYFTEARSKQADWSYGASEAFANYVSSAQNVAAQTKDLFTNAFKGMEDALVSFVTTGKGDFKSLANSIISDLVRIQVRAALTNAAGGGGGWLSNLLGGTTNVAGANLSTSFVKDFGITATGAVPMAKGGVFKSPSLSAYSGQIHSSPQFFAFAKGAGVFGEAGPEAIMPLARGPGGVLGVRSSGGGSTELEVEVHVHNSGAPATATVQRSQTPSGGLRLDVLLEQIKSSIADDVAAGTGPIPGAMESRFGLRTAVG